MAPSDNTHYRILDDLCPHRDINHAMSYCHSADTDRILKNYWRRVKAARNAGGIAMVDVFEKGKEILPKGWWLDSQTYYYLPPNVILLP